MAQLPDEAQLHAAAAALGLRYVLRRGLTSRSSPGHALYVDCPRHGAAKPFAQVRAGAGVRYVYRLAIPTDLYDLPVAVRPSGPGSSPEAPAAALCPTCLGFAPTRSITLRAGGGEGTRCGGTCLAGKRSCDCHCRGLCHGAAACVCSG
jgi:hypothetical protein